MVMASWVIWHILRNTNGDGDRVRKELEGVLMDMKDKSVPTVNIDQLEGLHGMIYEIGRLYQTVMLLRYMECDFETNNGYVIPAGDLAVVCTSINGRDERYFANPLKFDSSRVERGEAKKAQAFFTAFGTGTHPCTGKKLALLEVCFFVGLSLHAFDMCLVDDDYPKCDVTRSLIDVERHPPVSLGQPAFIWRPAVPVKVLLKRKVE